ncbi:hypothetical protein GCM10009841_14560 [Microlunatus panaciterrae]|uniref:Uncharacterized protein n=1 Tax=Microlunatus panaciterrae TaxID=400768 RepID=A0ABS2RLZ9_9ACTN|nr:T3SS effector HopA1 family protein [Microlunatus panaciterrae]MBM7800016.1 hypothetical protein [Microlunatus panaciterrae]
MPHWAPEPAADLHRAAELGWPDSGGQDELTQRLYHQWYAAPDPDVGPVDVDELGPPLAGVLRQAHAGSSRWLEATVLRTGASGVLVVGRPGEPARAVVRGDYAHPAGSQRLGMTPVVGERVSVRDRRDAPPTEGWWRTWGAGWNLITPPGGLTRIYLAPRPDRLPALLQLLTRLLLSTNDPWMIKVAADPVALRRPDATVVYLPVPLDQLRDSALLGQLCSEAGDMLRRHSPPLTLRVAAGIAAAEDPGDGRSFGELCCSLVAAGIAGSQARDDVPAAVAGRFRAAGLDPAEPYLRPRPAVPRRTVPEER